MKKLKRMTCLGLSALCAAAILAGCGNQNLPVETENLTINPPVEETDPVAPVTEDETEPTPAPTPEPTPSPSPTPGGSFVLYRGGGDDVAPMPTGVMDPGRSQDQKIQDIRTWFYATEDKSRPLEEHVHDDDIRSYWHEGNLEKISVKEVLSAGSPQGTTYDYYYHDGVPYFAYIVGSNPHTELRLYFWNGVLVRYIETDMVVHDLTPNAGYEKYCQSAWELSQKVLKLEAE